MWASPRLSGLIREDPVTIEIQARQVTLSRKKLMCACVKKKDQKKDRWSKCGLTLAFALPVRARTRNSKPHTTTLSILSLDSSKCMKISCMLPRYCRWRPSLTQARESRWKWRASKREYDRSGQWPMFCFNSAVSQHANLSLSRTKSRICDPT